MENNQKIINTNVIILHLTTAFLNITATTTFLIGCDINCQTHGQSERTPKKMMSVANSSMQHLLFKVWFDVGLIFLIK